MTHHPALPHEALLRRRVFVVAALNLGYFFVEFAIAVASGSISLLADSVDFAEDAAVNALIFIALGWPLVHRAVMGKVMAAIICLPAIYAAWEAIQRFGQPEPPQVWPVVWASVGAIVINASCALLLAGVRRHGGSLTTAAFLSARNDVLVNAAIIAMALITAATGSPWPDLVLGCLIIGLAFHSAWEVWEVSEEERLAAKALAGESID